MHAWITPPGDAPFAADALSVAISESANPGFSSSSSSPDTTRTSRNNCTPFELRTPYADARVVSSKQTPMYKQGMYSFANVVCMFEGSCVTLMP